MASRAVLQVFEDYQASRTKFVQTVAELAMRPQNIEALQNAGIMQLLRPLLLDTVPSIQQSSALALGRLAGHSEELAEAVVMNEVLPQLVYSLSEQNRYYKKAASFVLRSVSKHTAELAQAVVDAGALEGLVECLSEFEPSVKEGAAWALAHIGKHGEKLAQSVVDAGALPQLILCIQEPELSLKRIATSAISELAKHTRALAQAVVDCGAIAHLVALIGHSDGKLKRQVCSALAQIAKHSIDLAEAIVEAEIFPKILSSLKDLDMVVRKNAATLIREIAKHTPELARLVVNASGDSILIEYITESKGNTRLPGVMALGYIAAFSDTLALAIIVHQGLLPLKDCLINEEEDYIKAAAAWTLGQLGRHSPDHAKALAQADILSKMIGLFHDSESSDDLKLKCMNALKLVLTKCTHLNALQPLLLAAKVASFGGTGFGGSETNLNGNSNSNGNSKKMAADMGTTTATAIDKEADSQKEESDSNNGHYQVSVLVAQQFAKILPNDTSSRKPFAQSGCLQQIQEMKSALNQEKGSFGGELLQHINTINACFPQDLVQYYSPNYSNELLKKLDEPQA